MAIPYRPLHNSDASSLSNSALYQSLSPAHFRLLRLEGFTVQGVLECFFQCTPLSDPGEYSATSYTWNETEHIWYGDHDPSPKPIWVDGTLVKVSDKVANILCLALQVCESSQPAEDFLTSSRPIDDSSGSILLASINPTLQRRANKWLRWARFTVGPEMFYVS